MSVTKNAVDHVKQAFAAGGDPSDVSCLAAVERAGNLLIQHFRHAEDAREGGAQLVADHRHELVFELVGKLEFAKGGLQVGRAQGNSLLEDGVSTLEHLLVLLLVGDVAVDADHAQRYAGLGVLKHRIGLDVANGAAGQHNTVRPRPLVADLARITLCRIRQRQVVGMDPRAPVVIGDPCPAFFGGNTIELKHAVIPREAVVSEVPSPDADAGGVGGQLQALVGGAQLFLELLTFGDVDNRGKQAGFALKVHDLDGKQRLELFAALRTELQLVSLKAFLHLQYAHSACPILRADQVQLPAAAADDLLTVATHHGQEGTVGFLELAIGQAGERDAYGAGTEQLIEAIFGAAQGFLGLVAGGDVARRAAETQRPAGIVIERAQDCLDPEERAVLAVGLGDAGNPLDWRARAKGSQIGCDSRRHDCSKLGRHAVGPIS